MAIEVQIQLEELQEEAFCRLQERRYGVMVCHRRFGKTYLSTAMLVYHAMSADHHYRGAYIAPTYRQAKDVAWDQIKEFARPCNASFNESELRIDFPNGARIRLYGAENPDSLRGLALCDVVFDEVADMPYGIWGDIVLPMLLANDGRALFIGTPKGMNALWQIWENALQNPDKWVTLMFRASETGILSQEALAVARAETTAAGYEQEYECSFLAAVDNTVIPFSLVLESIGRRKVVDMDLVSQYPLVIGVDVARFKDASVFFPRRGLYAYEPIVMRDITNTELSHRLVALIAERDPSLVCIDQGQGTGVIDLVRDLTRGQRVIIEEVPFGSSANDDKKYANRRAEMWFKMRDWLTQGGVLPDDAQLKKELSAPVYSYTGGESRILLEPKDKLKQRLGCSPDLADALALTFAVPLGPSRDSLMPDLERRYGRSGAHTTRDWMTGQRREDRYDPFA